MIRTTPAVLWVSSITVFITGAALYAGPLNPPGGPVASTAKTLAEVEPRIAINVTNTPGDADSLFKITQPGSYYLAGNITGVVGKHGIEIAASGVTLDLNGFDLVGSGTGSIAGVRATLALINIAVINGSVRNWGAAGVELLGSNNCRVDGVMTRGNFGVGIAVGDGTTVSNCLSASNAVGGIVTANGCTVMDCTANFTAGNGISTGIGSTVTNCTAYNNGSGTGISIGRNCTISNCTASLSGVDGISADSDCTISNCTTYFNNGDGISTADGCTITGCTAIDNRGSGIISANGCTVTNCTVAHNSSRGINANNGCQITGCTTRNNESDGIAVNFSCTVSGNNCNGDGTAFGNHGGIRVLGQANRIEGNNVTYADRGLLVESGGNVIVRNTVKGCTLNWSIVAGNALAPIASASTNAAAVSGDTYGGTLGSTDPNANLTY